jgi:tRNA G18 (ribose-2'-O)-methylase SpoU
MAGDSESLNASISAALASFEIMRVRTPLEDDAPG